MHASVCAFVLRGARCYHQKLITTPLKTDLSVPAAQCDHGFGCTSIQSTNLRKRHPNLNDAHMTSVHTMHSAFSRASVSREPLFFHIKYVKQNIAKRIASMLKSTKQVLAQTMTLPSIYYQQKGEAPSKFNRNGTRH